MVDNYLEKKYLVAGLGVSGLASAGLLLRQGIIPILYDGAESFDVDAFRACNPDFADLIIVTGQVGSELLKEIDIAILSPGIALDSEIANALRGFSIDLWGEIELAYKFGKGKIAAITGTNGKTTTTSLVGHICKIYNDKTFVVGNIGLPYTAIADQLDDDSISVIEVSSFQLETCYSFKPDVAAILNITEDHLNRHHTMDAYINAKFSVTQNMDSDSAIILNYEDNILRKFGDSSEDKNINYFSSKSILTGSSYKDSIYADDEHIYLNDDEGIGAPFIGIDDIYIPGRHNIENVMAAILICLELGIPSDVIIEGIESFRGVEHRIEFVCNKFGIDFYNDSKGTNPDASIKAVEAMTKPTVIIAGGYDKDANYDEFIESFKDVIKGMVVLGATKDKIKEAALEHGFDNIDEATDLHDAIDKAIKLSKEGYAVLLSPACASWGMFKNFEQRGNVFKEYVLGL